MYNCIKKSRNKCSFAVISIEFYKLKCSRKQNLNIKLTLFRLEHNTMIVLLYSNDLILCLNNMTMKT